MRVGLLVTGDTSVRAAHSLSAHGSIEEVVVVGPASSKSFKVVPDASGCDVLVGSGSKAPSLALAHGVPLIWDGLEVADGVIVWGASPEGIAMSMAHREPDPRLVAVAHPAIEVSRTDRTTRFPDPVGRLPVEERFLDERPIAVAQSNNEFAACLAVGVSRRVTVVDDGAFLAGVALAAAVAAVGGEPVPVWRQALPYLEAVTEMGLVMAESE